MKLMTNVKRMAVLPLVCLCAHHNNMWAYGGNDSLMTLKECMEYAVSKSTKMRIQAADRSDERLQRRQSILQTFTPNVSANAYANSQYGRNLDPETNTYKNVNTFYNGYSVSAGITLFNGLRSVNHIKMASIVSKMGISKEQQTRDEICLATMESYYNVVYYSELEKILEEQVKTAETARDKVVRQEELGQKGYADVLQMESELASKRYLFTNAHNQLNEALLTLKDVMFWPMDKDLPVYAHISAPTLPSVSASRLTEVAKSVLPSADIASKNRDVALADLRMARGDYSPTVSLYGGWSTTYYTYPGMEEYRALPFGTQFRNNGGEYVQLSLSIPIYDQMGRRATLKKKKNALMRAEAEYDQTMRDIECGVANAVNDRDGALAAFKQADRLAEVRKEAFAVSAKQFEKGLISAIEYQTASQTHLEAMAERTGSLLKLRLKDAVVRYYNGEDYIAQCATDGE